MTPTQASPYAYRYASHSEIPFGGNGSFFPGLKRSNLLLTNTPYMILIILVIPFNVYLPGFREEWKSHVKAFDKWAKRSNRLGSWIVFSIVMLSLLNFYFSLYLFYQI